MGCKEDMPMYYYRMYGQVSRFFELDVGPSYY